MVWVLKLGVNLELNVVNGMAGTSMPVNGLHLGSVRWLVTGKNAELKRVLPEASRINAREANNSGLFTHSV